MVMMGEARGTPSYVSPVAMQSPRYGGCVSAFFHLFDWTSAKRFSSAKRLRAAAASKAEKPGSFRRSRSYRADHGKTRMRYDEIATTRPPGVVARLMGLDSFGPEAPRHRSVSSTPVLLQDLLKQDFKAPKTTKSLRDRLFTKRAHRQYKPGRALTAFRCRSEEWCISPAFVDVPQPAQSRSFMYAMTQKEKPFLSRLPPSSLHGEQIPELSLLQARSSGRDNILLQGWPLAGQHNVPRDLYHETEGSSSSSSSEDQQQESVDSKPTDSTASSMPLLTKFNKVVQGRRRSSSWNGSDDGSDDGSESTIDSHRRTVVKKSAATPLQSHHRRSKPLSVNPESKSRSSRSSPTDRLIPVEISASHLSTGTSRSSSTGELQSVSSKARGGSRAGRPGAKFTNNSPKKNASSQAGKTTNSKEHLGTTERTPAMAPGKPPPDRAKGKGSHGIHHLPKSSLLCHSKLVLEEAHKPPAKLQRFTEKAAASGVMVCTDRLKTGNAEDQSGETVVSNSKRMKQSSQARSVDALFPELPLESSCEPTETRQVPVERVLFSPDFDFTECSNGAISMSPLIDYDELRDPGDYEKEREGVSTSPLIDCENELISVVSYPPVDLEVHWEDEIVETILSGRCCERSCSGPSISSRSVTFSDEERNGDSWSSCASYNPGDCDSLSDSPRTNFQVKELDVEAEVLHQEPKSPPLQKKSLEESLVDEAAGQPSPVSVLQSPFHDETCTTSESSPESTGQKRSEEIEAPTVSNSDRIKQALLDISMFRIHDEYTCEHTAAPSELHPVKDEQSFIREVLSAANFLARTPGSSPNWHNKDLAIDPSLFDRLESEGVALASGGLWRCDRKLLFDCVNEAFGHLWHLHREAWAPELVCRLSRPRGPQLVVTVVKKIEEWRKLASFAIDSLIERDMSVHSGTWKFIAPEVAEVVVEIESMVWTGILDEVVVDIGTTHTGLIPHLHQPSAAAAAPV